MQSNIMNETQRFLQTSVFCAISIIIFNKKINPTPKSLLCLKCQQYSLPFTTVFRYICGSWDVWHETATNVV